MATPPARYAFYGPTEAGNDNTNTWDFYGYSDTWQPGMQSLEGWAPGYYTDNTGTFGHFMERAVLGGLAAIAGAGALGYDAAAAAPQSLTEAPVFDEWDFGGDVFEDFGGGGGDIDFSGGDVDLGGGGFNLPSGIPYGGIVNSALGGSGGAVVTRTGALGGAAAMGAGVALRGLWTVLRSGGSRMSTFVINGIKGRMTDLWPAVSKYGPQAVAAALGIGAAELAQLLMAAPRGGRRRRQRGISAADVRRTKRVTSTLRRMTSQLGLGRGGGGGYRGRSRGRGRGGRARWVRVDGY